MAGTTRRNKNIGLLFMALGIVVYIATVVYFNFTQDDAFITFRYASNFLNGNGLVYNIGERVEGYTNFLWLLLMITGKLAGFEFVLFSRILGVLSGVGTIIFTYLIGIKIFERSSIYPGLGAFLLGTFLPLGYWSAAGLETAAFSLMTIAAIYYYLNRSFATLILLVLATLFRPEGGLVCMVIIAFDIISKKSFTGYALTILAGYGILLLPYLIFKLYYFETLLPNPFYAKTAFDLRQLINGLEYSWLMFWHYLGGGIFIVPFLIYYKKWTAEIKALASFLLIYILYVIIIGGDVLKVHRFFIPLFPVITLVTLYGLAVLIRKRIVFWGSLAILLAWQLYIPYDHIRTYHVAEKALNVKMNKTIDNLLAIDKSNFSIAVSTIGIVGYRLQGHTVIDLLGLTDSTVARHPEKPIKELKTTWKEEKYNSEYILSRQPDYILFSTEFKPSAPAEKALFLYSKFLDFYRTIGFYFDGVLHAIFKRYYNITGNITRNIDPEFVQEYYDGIIKWNDKDFDIAIRHFEKALQICPEPKYPYLYYLIADANRQKNDFETAYYMLNFVTRLDTLIFEAYKDLYLYEKVIIKNPEKADFYHKKVAQLAPSYIPRLEYLGETVQINFYPEAGDSIR